MWCLRLLLIVVLLPWSSSVKRGHAVSSAPPTSPLPPCRLIDETNELPATETPSAPPTSPLPPCRLIDETNELPATETPATPIQDVTRVTFLRSLHFSEGGTTAWTKGGTEALQHLEKNCKVKVEGKTTKVKRTLFTFYHPNDGCPSRDTMYQRARTDAMSDEEKKAVNAKTQQRTYVESHPQS